MKYYTLDNMSVRHVRESVMTIGVFDGFHLGHQHVIRRTKELARKYKTSCGVLTFNIHPVRYLDKQLQPLMIFSLEHRLKMLRNAGVDYVVVLEFDKELQQIPALQFIEDIVIKKMKIRHLVLGYDCKFGRNAEGDGCLARRVMKSHDRKVTVTRPHTVNDVVASSTLIRRFIQSGKLKLAEDCMGRPVSLLGTVVRGKGLGRKLDAPTINLDLHGEIHPPAGVYLTWAVLDGKTRIPSITNVDDIVETHLLGKEVDLYGEDAEILFIEKVRPTRRFRSQSLLKKQIASDISKAAKYFKSHS